MMKKVYMKPYIEVEVYALDAAIAANCGQIVSMGPEAPGYKTCDEFKDAFEMFVLNPSISTFSTEKPFYADGSAGCTCYHTSADSSYFTS